MRNNPFKLRKQALDKLYAGNYEDTIKVLNEAIELDSQSDTAYLNRGVAKSRLGKYEDAIVDYDKAIQLAASDTAYYNRGFAKAKLGKHDAAIDDFTMSIKLEPKFVPAYTLRGESKAALGQHEDAIDDYNKAIELESSHAVAYVSRADAFLSLNSLPDATRDLSNALRHTLKKMQDLSEEIEKLKS